MLIDYAPFAEFTTGQVNLNSYYFLQSNGEDKIKNTQIIGHNYGQDDDYESIIESLAFTWPNYVF